MPTARNRIMKMDEYKDHIQYRAACQCGNPDCDMHLFFEVDKELNNITLQIYKNLTWASYWQSTNWFHEMWVRIKTAFKILFTGYIRVEETFIMQENQIKDFVISLQEATDKLERYRNENVVGRPTDNV